METFLFEDAAPGVKLLTLDRPERLNAVNWQMVRELDELLRSLRHQHEIRAIVLTGAGRAFCAGLDIKDPASLDPDDTVHAYDLQELFGSMCASLREAPVPVIAAVNGAASGAGLVFALAADIRLAAPEARFNMANVRIGFSGCDLGSSYLLPRVVGLGTGQIARNSPWAVRMTKQVLAVNVDSPSLRAAIELENRTQILSTRTADFDEAMNAFKEKREPRYGGR